MICKMRQLDVQVSTSHYYKEDIEMTEYYKLIELIKDYDNGAIEEKEFWIQVIDLGKEGLKWYHKIMQDDL